MTISALEKLGKWRMVLAGWIFGSRTLTSPGTGGMRDLMDKHLIARVESSAIAALLIQKGVFTGEEFAAQMEVEAAHFDREYEQLFPGFRTTATGISIYDQELAQETMTKLGFPE